MARDYFINGECLVRVKGATNSTIANLSELGLADNPIRVSYEFKHSDIKVDAWGSVPPESQFMLAVANVSMTLVHIDRTVLDECVRLSMGGGSAVGVFPRAGTRMGGGGARFATTNNLIGLNLTSPVGSKPYRFLYSYLSAPPLEIPLGVEKSIFTLQWRVIPYTIDPWNNGLGAAGTALWDHTADT